MRSKAFAAVAALGLAGTLPLVADAGKPVKPVPDNAAAYPVFVDATDKIVGPAILADGTSVVVRLNGYTVELTLMGLDNGTSADFSKAEWSRYSIWYEQVGCVGTPYLASHYGRAHLGFSARGAVGRDPTTGRDKAFLFPSTAQSTTVLIQSILLNGSCNNMGEPYQGLGSAAAVQVDLTALYTLPLTIK